jgi:hypothetical protein
VVPGRRLSARHQASGDPGNAARHRTDPRQPRPPVSRVDDHGVEGAKQRLPLDRGAEMAKSEESNLWPSQFSKNVRSSVNDYCWFYLSLRWLKLQSHQ